MAERTEQAAESVANPAPEAVGAGVEGGGGGPNQHDVHGAVMTALLARVLYEAVLIESRTYEGAVPVDLN